MNNLPKCLILDIGGTLTKLCFVAPEEMNVPHNPNLTIKIENSIIYFHFFKLIEDCWNYIDLYLAGPQFEQMMITGGGAYKFQQKIKEISQKNGKKVIVLQQFESLLGGMSFFQKQNSYEEFIKTTFEKDSKNQKNGQTEKVSYKEMNVPIIITNVGSGVSFLLLNQDEKGVLKAQRIGGTSLGGGFFLGLATLLTGQNNYQKLVEMAQEGNESNIDFTPKDFPTTNEQLSEATVLISLGKLTAQSKKEDIIRSLFYMVTFNIAQIALGHSEIHNVDNVLFTGFYCRDNEFILQCFTEAFNFFSKKSGNKEKTIYSLKHDGYLGVLGALGVKID